MSGIAVACRCAWLTRVQKTFHAVVDQAGLSLRMKHALRSVRCARGRMALGVGNEVGLRSDVIGHSGRAIPKAIVNCEVATLLEAASMHTVT
ncbi:hypothetical protein AU476_25350 [Cupriavidus sp. UYMSc13B]|nr:hypothetical protein AU476_25350 [Cupriavidus sp. UYMSc13B]